MHIFSVFYTWNGYKYLYMHQERMCWIALCIVQMTCNNLNIWNLFFRWWERQTCLQISWCHLSRLQSACSHSPPHHFGRVLGSIPAVIFNGDVRILQRERTLFLPMQKELNLQLQECRLLWMRSGGCCFGVPSWVRAGDELCIEGISIELLCCSTRNAPAMLM